MGKIRFWLLATLLIVGLLSAAVAMDWLVAIPASVRPTYVGTQSCAQCHQAEYHKWSGSHHDLAMDLATDVTVLADFDDQQITYNGVTSKLFRRDGKFYIHTEGPDGKFKDFQISHVIGYEPLQQYMVQFDDGRVQVLRESWDTENERWFYHYPPGLEDERLKPDDPLHWTGRQSNWNFMCAECHVTDLRKTFDVDRNRFEMAHQEIDVGCEACHGPGSIHVQLAGANSLFWDRHHGYGLAQLKSRDSKVQIEMCATCHARRRRHIADDYRSGKDLLDYYEPEILREGLYHADGQILDEVYVYGSYVQSKMYAKGVRCTDCHDPHTARLKHDGNKLCTSCHQHPAGKYDVPAHHHHKVGSTGASCVECHMPTTHYMIVDPRRDHSMRVPRPELSVDLGTPNACTACHLDAEKSDQWEHYADWLAAARDGDPIAKQEIDRVNQQMTDAMEKWYGPKEDRRNHFAYALDAARRQKPTAHAALAGILTDRNQPAIVRATAADHLVQLPAADTEEVIRVGIQDPDPLVRTVAVAGAQGLALSGEKRVHLLAPLLNDPVRAVRTEAARAIAPAHRFLNQVQMDQFRGAVAEFREAELVNNDQPSAHFHLGNLSSDLGDHEDAIRHYRTALRLDEEFVLARFNLGLLFSRIREDKPGVKEFLKILEQLPKLAERNPTDTSIKVLKARTHYRLGLLWGRMRQLDDAERAFKKALQLDPEVFDYLYVLGLLYLERHDWPQARTIAQQLVQRFPDSPVAKALLRDAMQQKAPASGERD